jgi:hypothetical protein
MFDQLLAIILASLIKGFPTTTTRTTTKQNVDPAVYYVYSRVKTLLAGEKIEDFETHFLITYAYCIVLKTLKIS